MLAAAGQVTGAPPLDPERRAQVEKALAARDYERAETILVGAVNERDPKSRDLLRFLGHVFFSDKKYLNCAVAMKKAEKLGGIEDRDRFTLAMAYVALGRRDWARPELEKLDRADTRSALYPYWLGRLDYDDRQYGSAVANYRRALSRDPEFAKAYDNLGLCLDMMGLLEEAVAAYSKGVELNRKARPPSPWPPLNLGTLLTRLGRLEEAEQRLREAVGYQALLDKARYQLGIVLERIGKLQEAVAELSKAAELSPDSASPHLALGRIYRALGNDPESQRAFNRFRELKKKERPNP